MDIKKLRQNFIKLTEKEEKISYIVSFGSLIEKSYRKESDIRIGIAYRYDNKSEIKNLIEEINLIFAESLQISLIFNDLPNYQKYIIYLHPNYQRIEIYIFKETEVMKEFWLNKDSISIIYDPHSIISHYFEKISSRDNHNDYNTDNHKEIENNNIELKRKILKNLIKSIIYLFEIVNDAQDQGDIHIYQYNYSKMIHKALQIHAILEDDLENWFAPKQVISHLMDEVESKFILRLIYNQEIDKINKYKRDFLDWFIDLVERVEGKFSNKSLPLPIDKIEEFCESILQRNFLWNFRKVKGIKGVYRSSNTAPYDGTKQLEDFLKKNNITTIIDLREEEYIKDNPDTLITADKLKLKRVHVDYNVPTNAIISERAIGYVRKIVYCQEETIQFLDTIAESEGSVLFHCADGKDRTGILAAILQMLVGYPEKDIVNDYLNSGIDTTSLKIQQVIDYINSKGGVKNYLEDCGVKMELQNSVIKKIKLN